MDLNSTYKERPSLLWIAILIVAGVGVWYLIQGVLVMTTDWALPAIEGLEELEDFGAELVDMVVKIVGGIFLFLAFLTLILAFLLFSGSKGGRTVMVIILVISVIFSAINLVFGSLISIIELSLALAVLVILYQPPVKAYFGKN